jgi:prepilin-type N-terminal cleavage/methylation domain-containing protein
MKNRIHSPKRERRQKGFTLHEVLVSALILGVCLAGIASMWYFSFKMNYQIAELNVAYNVARQQIEEMKRTGFTNTAEATTSSPTTAYYDATGNKLGSSTGARYKATMSVVSSATVSGSSPTTPADSALRTVTVKVYNSTTNKLIHETATQLAKGGV